MPDIIFYDECHGSVTEKFIEVVNRYTNSWLFGFTATPYREDEKGLKDLYDYLITTSKIDVARLKYKGYADLKPKVKNDTPENKAKNRRTEFKVLAK
jgi:superfamily II DNA or RNA helicase